MTKPSAGGTVSIGKAAELLGLRSRNELYRLIDSGYLPSVEEVRGQRAVKRLYLDGLEKLWANRPRNEIHPPRTAEGRAERRRSQAIRAGQAGAGEEAPVRPRRQRTSEGVAVQVEERPPGDPRDQGWDDGLLGNGGLGLPGLPTTTPNLEDQKAWTEFEKRYKIRMENMKEAGLLVYREDYDAAYRAVIAQIKSRVERIGKLLQVRKPTIGRDVIEAVEELSREALEAVADYDFAELEG